MIVLRILVAGVAMAALLATFLVLPRGVPARLARATFLAVQALLLLRLRLGSHRADYRTRDPVFSLRGPLGVFDQLLVWSS